MQYNQCKNLDKFRSQVLVFILEVDCFGHSDAIFGNFWTSPRLFNDHISTLRFNNSRIKIKYSLNLWTHCYGNCIRKHVNSSKHGFTTFRPELQILGVMANGNFCKSTKHLLCDSFLNN